MADEEKEYIIPLRKEWLKVQRYRRTGRAIKAIKEFIAKHMKIPDRNISMVKIDPVFNQEIWFRGKTKPPNKVKVKAVKEGDIVRVELVEIPQILKFAKARHEKRHKKAEEKKPTVSEEKKEEEKEKTEEEIKDEKEKSKSAEIQHAKEAKQEAKTQKHALKDKTVSKGKSHRQFRQALKK